MNQKLGATISQPFGDREYLYSTSGFDWFKFSNPDPMFPREFRSLLEVIRPQILHLHHFINFGVEALLHARETLPSCKIVLTLHEYLGICHHYGQMITKQNRTLCYEASPYRCSNCFKEIAPSDFFLRNLYIRRFFELVDHFVSPSEFLAERYSAWGVPEKKISVIENVVPPSRSSVRAMQLKSSVFRVGFFGQVSLLKGINVLFDAAENLAERETHDIVFDIFGDYSGQPPEFREDFVARLGKAGRNVKFHGPYDQNRVDQLMQSVDVVLLPSIWWENSPVVIQEALRNQRPIVCSDIGGMAEKVRDGIDGFHFPVGNSTALATLLLSLAANPDSLNLIRDTMRSPFSVEEIVLRHRKLYAALLSLT